MQIQMKHIKNKRNLNKYLKTVKNKTKYAQRHTNTNKDNKY